VIFRCIALAVALVSIENVSGDPIAQQLPDPEPFFAAVKENLFRAQDQQRRFGYTERRTEPRLNPFGRLGSGPTRVYEFTPTADPIITYRRLVEEDGRPVTNAPAERLQRRARPPSRSSFEDAIAALEFTIDRRELLAGRPAVVVKFRPRRNARPQTREGRMARALTGVVWVDEDAREVVKVDAATTDDLSFGYGLIARLGEGTTVAMTRQQVAGDLWMPVSLRFKGEGRALVFRKLNVDYRVEWFDYKQVPNPKSQ
jgi:hypothetical protein